MVGEQCRVEAAARGDGDEDDDLDRALAEEIARFVADRAFAFEDHECRAWALTDFEAWTMLAGRVPRLAITEAAGVDRPEETGSAPPSQAGCPSGPSPATPDASGED